MNMKNLYIITLLFACLSAFAQPNPEKTSRRDSVDLGYGLVMDAGSSAYLQSGVDRKVLEKATQIDPGKILYGRITGLNVYQGSGQTSYNTATLSLHGRAPLVIIDGSPRSLNTLTAEEIESIQVLNTAVATALYGVRGANGVVIINTRRGTTGNLNINISYQFGLSTQFRSPEFADSYTYGNALNEALKGDGLAPRYNDAELEAFRTGRFPEGMPNVNWWKETMRPVATNHRANMTFNGGTARFKYFAVVDYMYDEGFFRRNTEDSRYDNRLKDTQLNVRGNMDIMITRTTEMKVGVLARLQEFNKANYGDIYSILYNTPSAAFPIKYQEENLWGGDAIYGKNNPVALLMDTGNTADTRGTLWANLSLKQDFSFITPGLKAEAYISFDNIGTMYDQSVKNYQYMDSQSQVSEDGTWSTLPKIYGAVQTTLGHSSGFSSIQMASDFNVKIDYDRTFGKHDIKSAVIYDQQVFNANGRNASTRRQSILATASYSYANRYAVNVVGNFSGSAYLPHGDAFTFYPAIDAAWFISEEDFMKNATNIDMLKLYASFGYSGWDGNLSHELWRGAYYNSGTYYFTNNVNGLGGMVESKIAVTELKAEKVRRTMIGADARFFGNRFNVNATAFHEYRNQMLVTGSSVVSGIFGIAVPQECTGVYSYRGIDLGLSWNNKEGDLNYDVYANVNFLNTEVINENQERQLYDYLYHKGDLLNQHYGLEAIGYFESQLDIKNNPQQTFSDVRVGDLMYRDQNDDGVINDLDVVKIGGSSIPALSFGFGFNLEYKGIELSAAFQGRTGVTVNLLNSPLYQPLVNNGNISKTFLDREIPWTVETADKATMPRLTTLPNANNYRNSSFWLRDGSFLKLRDLTVAYTIPRKLTRFADMKVYLQGTNLFSIDGIRFADPEQLGANYPAVRSYWVGVKFNF